MNVEIVWIQMTLNWIYLNVNTGLIQMLRMDMNVDWIRMEGWIRMLM